MPAFIHGRNAMKYDTELTLDVEVLYENLDPLYVSGAILPGMVDITEINVLFKQKNGKIKKINITKAIPEEQRMLIEDEILESSTKE